MRLAVFASGSGSNLQAMIEASKRGKISGRIVLVLSDNEKSFALERARQHNIEAVFIDPRNYSDRETYDKAVVSLIQEKDVGLVVLAGFMRLLSPYFIREYRDRIMNIHPALLPSFPGVDGVRQALQYGVKVSGCTVHFVDEGLDTGPIILQEAVDVYDNDTVESLHERIHEVEHRLYPLAVQLFIEGRLRLEERRCFIDEK